MAKAFLQVVAGSRQGLMVPIEIDRPFIVGRRRGDLVLDDPLISSSHCRIVHKDGSFHLQDLASTNGTVVDGRLVREAVLRPGSEIHIGSSRLVLALGEPPARSPITSETAGGSLDIAWLLDEELVELPGTGERTRGAADIIGQDLRLPPGMNAVVEVVAGQDAGRSFRFARGNVSIGRRQGEVPLNDIEVSRYHAVIEVFGREMVFLRDLGSTNGTYHNGRRVLVSRLQAGDTIGCGKTVMKLLVSTVS